MNKIKRLSTIFKFVFFSLFLLYPLVAMVFWISPETFMNYGLSFIPKDTKILHALSWSDKSMGFLIALVPNIIVTVIMYCLFKLFTLYEQSKFFVVESARYLRKVGFLLLINDLILPFIVDPLMQLAITIHNPPGQRYTSVTVSTSDLYGIFTALLIILISWIMVEACKIQEEQQLTV